MDEMNYYAVLGVEPEEPANAEGAEEPEVTEPGETSVEETQNDESTAGRKAGSPQVLVPEGEEDEHGSEAAFSDRGNDSERTLRERGGETPHPSADADTFSSEGKASEKEKRLPQSAEENARFAAARRKAEAERDAEVARVRKEAKQFADAQIADILQTANFTNPYTGAPIRSMAEFDAYKERLQEEQRGAFMKQNGMTDEEYDAFIQSQPEVRKAKEAQKQAEAVIREAREKEAKASIDAQIEEISAINPAIKSLADITKLKSYPEIYEMVKRGYRIADAYKLTNLAEIESRAAQRAKQQAINAVQSKQHLEKTVSRGTGSVEVPAEVKAEYRMLDPGISDEEIQKHYASYVGRSN